MATVMPEDTQTPNEPNGVDQSKVPSVVGVTSPIDYTKEDPWGTLPPGAIKYEIDSTKWTAVPINQGVYKIVSRNEGQAIYVAEDAQGSQSLRITKSFNIETTGRTALYLKGQSDLDILVEQVVNLLATKADKESVYTKEETDQQIQNAINGTIGGLTSILTYKGTVANEAALAGIQNPAQGDTYQAEDTGLFYTWIAESAPGSWERLSGSIVDLSNYYTKGQIDLALTGKADQADLEALEQKVDLLLLQNKPFTYIQSTDPAAVDPDPTKAGEIWFDNSTGLIYIRKTSQIDQTLYWLNSIDNALLGLDTKYMKLEGDQTASGVKTFTGNIKLTTPPASDEDVANKKYVDESIANAGMGSANFVTLDATEQSIDGHKTFIGEISVPEPQNGTDAATKKYVDDKFQDATTTLPLNVVLTDSDQTISSIKTFKNGKNPRYNTHPADFTDLELVDKKYVDDAVAGGITLPLNLAYLDRANTFTATNNFTGVTNLYGGGSSYVDPVNDTDIANKKYVDNAIQQSGGGVDLSNLVTLNTEQTITGKKLFSKIQSTQAVTEDNDLTSKAYVDKAIADLGDTITLDGYAKLAEANTFTTLNTFDVLPQSDATPTDPKDLVTKQYNDDRLTGVENNINTKIGDLTQLTITNKDNLVNAINEVNSSTPKLLTQNLELTVGSGGKFSTIKDAISEALKYKPILNFTITIKLISDITEGRIDIKGMNLGYVDIDFNGFKVHGAIYIVKSIIGSISKINLKNNISAKQGVYTSSCIAIFIDVVTFDGFNDCFNINECSFIAFSATPGHKTEIASNSRFIAAERGAYINLNGFSINMVAGIVFSLSRGSVLSNSYPGDFTGGATECNIPKNTVTASGIYFKN